MAYLSLAPYEGDGSNTLYAVPFPYLLKSHVEVWLAGFLMKDEAHYTWTTDKSIQFYIAPPEGIAVIIKRNTPKVERNIHYHDSTTLTEQVMNADATQMFYIEQEVADGLSGLTNGLPGVGNGNYHGIATDVMDGIIKESKLFPDLNNRIDKIDGPASLPGSVAARLEDAGVKSSKALSDTAKELGAAITAETNARQNAVESVAAKVDTVTAAQNNTAAAVQSNMTAMVLGDQALATRIDQVAVTQDEAKAAIQAEQTARIDADGILATRIDSVKTQTADSDALAATQLTTIISSDKQAQTIARAMTAVQTTVAGNTTTVQLLMESVDGIKGSLFLKVDANGRIAGMSIGADADSSEVVFVAEKFFVAAQDMPGKKGENLFTVITTPTTINGTLVQPGVYLKTAYINLATITTVIANNAIIGGANIVNAAIGTAHLGDASITSAKIKDGEITNAKIGQVIQSANYVPGSTGWRINKDGSAEFSGVTIRGDFKAGSININNKFIVDAGGNVTIRSGTTGARLELIGGVVMTFDPNGALRTRMGVW